MHALVQLPCSVNVPLAPFNDDLCLVPQFFVFGGLRIDVFFTLAKLSHDDLFDDWPFSCVWVPNQLIPYIWNALSNKCLFLNDTHTTENITFSLASDVAVNTTVYVFWLIWHVQRDAFVVRYLKRL